jgi:hypothetical protein
MLIWFVDKDDNSIAINNQHVVSVYESKDLTVIETVKSSFFVRETILNVATRLNTLD